MYISSSNISVFPLAKSRGNQDRSSSMMFENNIANITRQLIDTDGFIISPNNTDGLIKIEESTNNGKTYYKLSLTNPIAFNLYGYYFELKTGAVLSNTLSKNANTETVLYAILSFNTDTREVSGQDEKNSYKGLAIIAKDNVDSYIEGIKQENNNVQCFKLPLLKVTLDSETNVSTSFVEESFSKILPKSYDFSISFIDGQR